MNASPPIVDLHAHLLPGLDDGPRTRDEALAMCAAFAEQGVGTVVATPHMLDPRYGVTPQLVRRAVRRLSAACRRRGIELDVLVGADVRLDPDLLRSLDDGELLTIGDAGRYLLLELPVQVVPPIGDLVEELEDRGIVPVVSHPERNLELWRKPHLLRDLVELGCLVQLTAGSLLGAFGPAARRAARLFLDAGVVHAVASDAHGMKRRPPDLARAKRRLTAWVGPERTQELLCANPDRIARGEPLPRPAPSREASGAAPTRSLAPAP